MSEVIALDVALLLPPDVAARAIAISAALPAEDTPPLRLDEEHLPHITLTQLFARANEMDLVVSKVDDTLRGVPAVQLRVTGAEQGGNSVWLAIDKAPALVSLHEQLMESLRGVERPDGGTAAFFGDDARLRDVMWVAGYRLKSSFHHFEPHITLGHAAAPPAVEPFEFQAEAVAVCHLGRYCACRRVLRRWTLSDVPAA